MLSHQSNRTNMMASVVARVTTFIAATSFIYRSVEGTGCLFDLRDDPGSLLIKGLPATVTVEILAAEQKLLAGIKYNDYHVSNGEQFDFIVVGGGSAGAVVASRLSENADWSVLLLEAGGDPTVTSEVPGLFLATLNSSIDWKYLTQREPGNCLGMEGQRCTWPRGKVLGGSSTINTMLYVRCHPDDFDGWERMGNPGWSYRHMIPYFMKSEDFRAAADVNPRTLAYHGFGGGLKVESYKHNISLMTETLKSGYAQLGLPFHKDVNADCREGLFAIQGTLEDARRCNTAKAFLHGCQSRGNLHISKNSLVTKILIDDDNNAYGVEFYKKGKYFKVTSSKEVIVSGGTVNSPQILMLSGIGPKEHLEQLGIEVKQDLPVGYNLQDHTSFRGFVVSLDVNATQAIDPVDDVYQFLINSEGPLTEPIFFAVLGFVKPSPLAPRPNMEIYTGGYQPNAGILLERSMALQGCSEEIIPSYIKANKKYNLQIMLSFLNPRSRGRILLDSKDPFHHPLIHPGYFTNELDLEDTLQGVKFATDLVNTDAMRKLGAKIEFMDIPGCREFTFPSDDYWRCAIRHLSFSVYHPVGTCTMGPTSCKGAVVDPTLRVIGVKGLRVVDASIMPTVPTGNTNAPTIAVAEKASDLIKMCWKNVP